MSIFQKIKSLLGLGGVLLADASGAVITAEKEAEFENSLELHQLLEGELKAVVQSQAGTIEAQKTALESSQAQFATLSAKVDDMLMQMQANAEAIEAVAVGAKTAAQKSEARIGEIAAAVNKHAGRPLVEPKEADAPAALVTGEITQEQTVTLKGYFNKVKGGE